MCPSFTKVSSVDEREPLTLHTTDHTSAGRSSFSKKTGTTERQPPVTRRSKAIVLISHVLL